MSDFLHRMAGASTERVRAAKALKPEPVLIREASDMPDPPPVAMGTGRFALIAEIKYRSPSSGTLETSDPEMVTTRMADRIRSYEAAGAAAISVLTEPTRFDGALDHVRAAARATRLPIMRKDFLVDPYQILEARAAGAGGVLLIVRMLNRQRLEEMLSAAMHVGLFVLLEVFGEDDMPTASELVATFAGQLPLFAGVNARDLATLRVDPTRFERLVTELPRGVPHVAESGINTPADARRVAALGYHAALVGTALMRSPNPGALARQLIAAGREEVAEPCV